MAESFPLPSRPPDGGASFAPGRGEQPASALLAYALGLGGATVAIFLAGGAVQGNLGVFLVFAGLAMLLCPPLLRLKLAPALAALALWLCAASALLPARWFSETAWRRALAVVPDLPLPSTVSAAPAQTLFWLAILALTTLEGLFLLTQPVRSRGMLTLALTGAGVCGAYAALSIYAKLSGWTYPFSGGANFGFLPNRNHTATLLVTGSLLSLGVLAVAFRERRWLTADAAVLTLTLCAFGVFFFSTSRAGVLFLLLGLGGWLLGLGRAHRSRPLLLTVVVVACLGGGLFFSVKSDARDRLLRSVPAGQKLVRSDTSGPNGELSADDRLRIYRDTLDMIRAVPLTGTGLGTFALVYPAYRVHMLNGYQVLHPESDWLMVAAETGLPATLCLLVLVGILLWMWRPVRTHPYWPLRWAVFMAAAAGILHGLVDVPAHRAAVGWWLLVLVALALQPGRAGQPMPPMVARAARGIFALGGLCALLLGGQLIRAEWFGASPLPPYVAKRTQDKILKTFQSGDAAAAMEQARAAVQVSPLSAPLYYQLGTLLLRFEDTDAETDRAFKIQRLLNPLSPEVPRAQATAWLPVDPARSAALFAEALDRQEKLGAFAANGGGVTPYLREILIQAAGVPAAQQALWAAASRRGTAGQMVWLESSDPAAVRPRLSELAADPGFFEGLKPEERQRFVAVWRSKGDPEALKVFLPNHPLSP